MGIRFCALLLLAGAARAEPVPLLCVDHGKLVSEDEAGAHRDQVEPGPPAAVQAVALAGAALVAVSAEGRILLTDGRRWRDLGKLTRRGGTGLLRAASDERGAHLFVAGGEDGQVAGAVDVSSEGKQGFRRHPADAARVAPPSLGDIDTPAKWQALRERLKDHLPTAVAPEEALVWAEPSPWGGTLVAVATGEVEGESPAAELWYVPAAGAPVSLRYQGAAVGYRGLLAYAGDALLADGRFSAARRGTLVLHKNGTVAAVPGVSGPCIARPGWQPAAAP